MSFDSTVHSIENLTLLHKEMTKLKKNYSLDMINNQVYFTKIPKLYLLKYCLKSSNPDLFKKEMKTICILI